MQVRESTENAFGTLVKGIEIRLTVDEAKLIPKMLNQGIAYPPKCDGMNTDHDATTLGGQLLAELKKITRG